MPKFPTYYGPPLPKVLNPLNPYHYWLVLSWLYFRPSHLKHYLYQADPELYRASGFSAVKRALQTPVYRNLYFIAIGLVVFLSTFILLTVTVGSNNSLDLARIATILGVGLLATALMLFVLQVWLGIIGVLAMLTLGIAVCVGQIAFVSNIGERWGTGIYLIVLGIGTGITFNSMFALLSPVSGVVLGTLIGVLAIGGMLALYPPPHGSTDAFIALSVVILAGSRGLFHLFELPLAWLVKVTEKDSFRQLERHPVIWDELNGWPFPGVVQQLRNCLERDLSHGLRVALNIAMNPVQRWVCQQAFLKVLLNTPQPLRLLDEIEHSSLLSGYLLVPITGPQASRWLAAREVFLGEIGQQYVDATGGDRATTERLTWALTRNQRKLAPVPIAQFATVLYALVHDEVTLETLDARAIKLAERFAPNYEGVRIYPNGDEVASSWASLAAFLEAATLEQIGLAHEQLAWIPETPQPYLSSVIMETLTALSDVSRSVAASLQATSLPNKTVALNQAAGGLQELVTYVEKELWPPEKALYLVLIKHWQSLVAAEQGRLGESALRQMSPSERLATGLIDRTSSVWQRPARPLTNPYVAGDPVNPPLFVGRRDIFTRINEIWRAKANPDSIILYGHRRMGKSSILRNLDQAAPGRVIAYVNLQGETSFIDSTAALLLALADRIYVEVKRARPDATLAQPPADQFTTPSTAQIHFNRFMEQVRAALGDSSLILALDEFEAIEDAVRDGKIDNEIYQFLRAKTQEPWITVVFGGLHTLDEMSRDYAQPFYGSYQNIVVSYLAPEDARHLITNPTPDFTLNYGQAAADRIIAATGGQPYLVQLVCRDALDHLNHELFDEHKEREAKITLADVDTVLGDDLFRRGTGYFDGVWTQISEAAQRDLLRCMAQRDAPWLLAELEEVTHLIPEVLHQHLQLAERRDILRQRDGAPDRVWEFCVPLMRRWIVWKE